MTFRHVGGRCGDVAFSSGDIPARWGRNSKGHPYRWSSRVIAVGDGGVMSLKHGICRVESTAFEVERDQLVHSFDPLQFNQEGIAEGELVGSAD